MLKKVMYFIGTLFLLFMLLTNFTILRYFLPQTYPHNYCADQCKYWTIEKAKGHHAFGDVIDNFNIYKAETKQPDLVLHRLFYRKWWQLWNWYDFLSEPCWDCPYAENAEET